ncbi:MAG TPA: hypothetical protein DCL75_02120 [Ktedonobacter sp.]|nr:hypothetical protein [Ktedonobacter sp.]
MLLHRYVLRSVPDSEWKKWDQFIDGHPGGHFLQSWGWGELKASAGWKPLRLSLWDEEQQKVVAAAQVLCRTAPHLPFWAGHLALYSKGTGDQLVRSLFVPGILYSTEHVSLQKGRSGITYGAK